jgi:hypothetical protein
MIESADALIEGFQWSAPVFEIPHTDKGLPNFKSGACDTFVPVGWALIAGI